MIDIDPDSREMLQNILIGIAVSPLVSAMLIGLYYISEGAVAFWLFFVAFVIWPDWLGWTRIGRIISIASLAGTVIPVLIWFWIHFEKG